MFRYTKWTFLREIAVWIFAFILLSPLFILVNVALKSTDEYFTSKNFELVKAPVLESFITVVTTEIGGKILNGMITSLMITTIAVVGLIFFGSLTAYVLVRRTSKMSNFAFYATMGGVVMPSQLGMVPVYIGAKNLGLLGNPIGMGIIYIMMLMPLAVMLYGGFVRSIPREFEEAAYIDGASKARTFFRIIFPQLAPATGTIAIMAGIITWNDFFAPIIYMAGSEQQTLPLVIFAWVGGYGTNWNIVFAVLIFAMLPMCILYLIFQKKFIQGFAGGLKG